VSPILRKNKTARDSTWKTVSALAVTVHSRVHHKNETNLLMEVLGFYGCWSCNSIKCDKPLPFKYETCLFYIRTQFVPRSKHSPSRFFIHQLMHK
jgi:hypothetical protein